MEEKKPWENLGMTYLQYYRSVKSGKIAGQVKNRALHRASGMMYENPPEKIEAIKNKYKNGVPEGEVEMWILGM